MKKTVQLEGQRFGRLIAISPCRIGRRAGWTCQCDCGQIKAIVSYRLQSGHTQSCGCKLLDGSIRRTHGMKGTRIYSIWKDMRKRCRNPATRAYHNYGGRGISVCSEWNKFENFLADMGLPSEGATLDRIDVNGPYSQDNCRWASRMEQCRNMRKNRILEHDGNVHCVSAWADRIGISANTLHRRLSLGWDVSRALTTPLRRT